jgi:lysozyme
MKWLALMWLTASIVSSTAEEFIARCEGLRLMVYPDTGGVPTCGYGHIGCRPSRGLTITKDTADRWLHDDTSKALASVDKLVKVAITGNQRIALASFVFNLGERSLSKSLLLAKLNREDYCGAAKEFLRWDRADGKVVKGLLSRRKLEQALFSEELKCPSPLKPR